MTEGEKKSRMAAAWEADYLTWSVWRAAKEAEIQAARAKDEAWEAAIASQTVVDVVSEMVGVTDYTWAMWAAEKKRQE